MNSELNFYGKKILITGASGFIGSHLCRRLSTLGGEIHAISRKEVSSNELGLNWYQGDISNYEVTKELTAKIKPHIIFHLASHVNGSRDLDNVIPTFQHNLVSSINIFHSAIELDCERILLAGSMEEPMADNTQEIPGSPYAVSKWAASAYARMFHALYNLPVVLLRIFMVYGPGQNDLSKLIPYVITSLLNGESPKLSSGNRQIDWIYIDDLVEGVLLASKTDDIEGKTIDLGSGKLISIRAVVEKLFDLINPPFGPAFGTLPDRPMEQIRTANISHTYSKIGWIPKTSVNEGLRKTVDWYQRYMKRNH